ncbi:MAG: VIT1/CCC1 transporter family protein [Acidobacteriota bacterium]|nr:VIT1/CCC1 transporter family protein [Acidobacteriota bacterium]
MKVPVPPYHQHQERHSGSGEVIRDIVIGLADGLTVPFALAAGLSGALQNTHLVVLAGLAEIAAGSIAMGLGGYLAAHGEAEHYASEMLREQREIVDMPEDEAEEIYEVFTHYGISRAATAPVLAELQQQPKQYVDFMMRFELGLEAPNPNRAWRSALTIAVSYIVGGAVPLAPYILMPHSPLGALKVSVAVTLLALILFGAAKGKALKTGVLKSAIQTALIGGTAAAAAYGLAKLLSAHNV